MTSEIFFIIVSEHTINIYTQKTIFIMFSKLNTFKIILIFLIIIFIYLGIKFINYTDYDYSIKNEYIFPKDKLVLNKLNKWQDLKFGVIFHWGIYCVNGIVESWSLVSEDEDFQYSDRINRKLNYDEYKKWYWEQNKYFNPTKFNPDSWAEIMQQAGMKYMIFTTKHHDGFCMYNSKYTDYSISKGPFSNNPKSNVAKEVFNSFRKKNFWIGAYFSKPDWHCQYYWSPLFATSNRRPNYNKYKHPDMWKKYVEYTKNQLLELTTEYGDIDILWLDGSCIDGSEIELDDILLQVRKHNPDLISVDRARNNHNENYLTPEMTIPKEQKNVPWEVCMPLSSWWSYRPNSKYKTANDVINILIEVTSKGGNLLLGIGPTADGEIDLQTQKILKEIGSWLEKNGKAIYETRTTKYYNDNNIWFNADKDETTLYALCTYNNNSKMPETIKWTNNIPTGQMTILSTGEVVKYNVNGNNVTIILPENLPLEPLVFKFRKSTK